MLEETIVLGPTPQSLISEGIAEAAPALLLRGAAGAELAAVVRDAGIPFDLDHALAIERARQPCRWAEINTALLLHGDGASEADAQAYLERWGVLTPELVVHLMRFITEPASRTYIFNYPAGQQLCAAYLDGDPARYRRLVTEQVRVRDLATVGR